MEKKKYNKKIDKRLTPFGYEYKCAVCDEYIPMYIYDHDNYVYKKIVKNRIPLYFCSWHCMREYENTHEISERNTVKERKGYLSRKYNK